MAAGAADAIDAVAADLLQEVLAHDNADAVAHAASQGFELASLQRTHCLRIDSACKVVRGLSVDIGTYPFVVLASALGRVCMVQKVADLGADLDVAVTTVKKRTALFMAARHDQVAVVELLVARGVNLEVKDSYGMTALNVAVRHSSVPSLRVLVAAGAKLDVAAQHGTPLHVCAQHSLTAVARLVIEAGADVNASAKVQHRLGVTPLHVAARASDVGVLKELLRAGAVVNTHDARQVTPLYIACEFSNAPAVRALLEKGALVTFAVWRTAIVKSKDIGIFEMLLEAGGDASVKLIKEESTPEGSTVLHLAANCHLKGPLVDFFVAAGARIDAVDRSGNTPLHVAAAANKKESVERLIAHGASCSVTNNDGKTPLVLGAASPSSLFTTLVKLLVNRGGADPNSADNAGLTALHYFSRTGRVAAASSVIAVGANVHARSNKGYTPLQVSCVRSWTRWDGDMLLALVKAGADFECRLVETGHRPIYSAFVNRDNKLLSALVSKAANPLSCRHSPDFDSVHPLYAEFAPYVVWYKAAVGALRASRAMRLAWPNTPALVADLVMQLLEPAAVTALTAAQRHGITMLSRTRPIAAMTKVQYFDYVKSATDANAIHSRSLPWMVPQRVRGKRGKPTANWWQ